MAVTGLYGKASVDEFEEWSKLPFTGFETYLTEEDFENFSALQKKFQEYSQYISVVHTPHVSWPENKQMFQQSVSLAQLVGAQLCIHSGYVELRKAQELDQELSIPVTYGYESSVGESYDYIKNAVLAKDLPFVFDVAHVYTGQPSEFLDVADSLLTNYSQQISLIHLCDGTDLEDGLPLTEGEIPLEEFWSLVMTKYHGPVTIEVPPDSQLDGLEFVRDLSG
jgi:sugar phosphate isomerase/epimerase